MSPPVSLRLPRQLWLYSGGTKGILLNPGPLRDVFHQLQQKQPLVYERICTESGQPREHVNVFVNRDLVRDLDAPVQIKPGDVITILPAISGG
jgi:molybdopterin converting factor small subunit